MRIRQSNRAWLLIFLLAATSPLFINVVLVEIVSITSPPMARTVLESGLFPEKDSFLTVMRVLDALFVGTLIAVTFGLPLAFLVESHLWVRCVIFVLGVIAASAVWHLSQEWGLAGFIAQWRYPEVWLSIVAACGVAALVSRARSRHQFRHVAP
jgi:hypothetical protein